MSDKAQNRANCRAADCDERTDLWLCTSHTDELETALGDVPFLLEQLTITATRQANVYRANARPTAPDQAWRGAPDALRPTPLPIDLNAADLRHELANTISTWARHLAEHRGRTVTGNPVAFLLANLDAIRIDEAAGELHRTITDAVHRARRAIDRSPSRVYAGPCHADITDVVTRDTNGTVIVERIRRRCDRDLYAPGRVFDPDWLTDKIAKGQPVLITCDGWSPDGQQEGCGKPHDVSDRQDWLVAELEGALVPLAPLKAFAVRVLHLEWPPASTVRSWIYSGRLEIRQINPRDGAEMFAAREVLDLVEAYRPHAYPKGRAARQAS